MKHTHQPKFFHAAPGFAAAQCTACGRNWIGNPSLPRSPRWVKDGLAVKLTEQPRSRDDDAKRL